MRRKGTGKEPGTRREGGREGGGGGGGGEKH